MSSGNRIKIIARLRPTLDGELDDNGVSIRHGSDSSAGSSSGTSFVDVVNGKDATMMYSYPFSSCYDQTSTQEEIFQNDVQPLIDVVYSGVTVTVFAYGVTSSGKTHTMQGSESQPGIIPRSVEALFSKMAECPYETSLTASYIEIYKDEVYDLFVERERAPKLPVRENQNGMVFVANLSSYPITSLDEFTALYQEATKQRSVASTKLNNSSSRSHSILTIHVHMLDSAQNRTITGKMNLVDLAGSESNKHTGNDKERLRESSSINTSLSTLGKVVDALNRRHQRIPYRDSKLTRILQDALGGQSMGLLICNIAPGTKFRSETIRTLLFATHAKNIENKPVIHEQDNRPPAKLHFSAPTAPAPALKPAILQPSLLSGNNDSGRPSLTLNPGGRKSMMPKPRFSRVAMLAGSKALQGSRGSFGSGNGSKENVLDGLKAGGSGNTSASDSGNGSGLGLGLTDKEIDERISKAVEAEVARRLQEREAERLREEQEALVQAQARAQTQKPQKSPRKEIPAGVLTPLLKRHRDLDDQLKTRLQELERKYERGNKEIEMAEVLSPLSRKKTGRAYVALARAHSEKGDLQVALDLYRKAESYVPDNIKLKERIIEIEYAVKYGKPFVPSPKKPRRAKGKKKQRRDQNEAALRDQSNSPRNTGTIEEEEDEEMEDLREIDEVAHSLDLEARDLLGMKIGTPVAKRGRDEPDGQTPMKRRKGMGFDDSDYEEEEEEDWEMPAASQKQSGRNLRSKKVAADWNLSWSLCIFIAMS